MKSLDWRTEFISSAEMTGHDKWIRSVKDNPAGKVVADPEGNRWEWDRGDLDETARLLKKLQNDELAIEQTDIVPNPSQHRGAAANRVARNEPQSSRLAKKRSGRDAGGGFDPYDSSGKSRRR
jgi:hypothetical protein